MNAPRPTHYLLTTLALSVLLAGCASPGMPEGAAETRAKLTQLQSDPQLATLAPITLNEAQIAVKAAEKPQDDKALGQHLVLLADRKVEQAKAQAQTRFYIEQRRQLSEQREGARLDSRTQEADQAKQGMQDLQQQLDALNAKETERGLVITLGDVLFATGRADLRAGTAHNLQQLAQVLQQHPQRTVLIEGHTDSVGSAASNDLLSQRRADSVKSYLQSQGVAANRINALGKGEYSPVASNDSASGRQMNRRVEVIISNTLSTR